MTSTLKFQKLISFAMLGLTCFSPGAAQTPTWLPWQGLPDLFTSGVTGAGEYTEGWTLLFRGADSIAYSPADGGTRESGSWGQPIKAIVTWDHDVRLVFGASTFGWFSVSRNNFAGPFEPIQKWRLPAAWTSVDAVARWGASELLFFRGKEFLLLDRETGAISGPNPVDTIENWPVSWSRVDAAVTGPDNKVYLFSGDSFCAIDPEAAAVITPGAIPIRGVPRPPAALSALPRPPVVTESRPAAAPTPVPPAAIVGDPGGSAISRPEPAHAVPPAPTQAPAPRANLAPPGGSEHPVRLAVLSTPVPARPSSTSVPPPPGGSASGVAPPAAEATPSGFFSSSASTTPPPPGTAPAASARPATPAVVPEPATVRRPVAQEPVRVNEPAEVEGPVTLQRVARGDGISAQEGDRLFFGIGTAANLSFVSFAQSSIEDLVARHPLGKIAPREAIETLMQWAAKAAGSGPRQGDRWRVTATDGKASFNFEMALVGISRLDAVTGAWKRQQQ